MQVSWTIPASGFNYSLKSNNQKVHILFHPFLLKFLFLFLYVISVLFKEKSSLKLNVIEESIKQGDHLAFHWLGQDNLMIHYIFLYYL